MIVSDKVTVMGIPIEVAMIFDDNVYTHDSGAELELKYNSTAKCFDVEYNNHKEIILLVKGDKYNFSDLVAETWVCFFKVLCIKYNKKDTSLDELSKEIYGYSISKLLSDIQNVIVNLKVVHDFNENHNEDEELSDDFDPDYDFETMKG